MALSMPCTGVRRELSIPVIVSTITLIAAMQLESLPEMVLVTIFMEVLCTGVA